MVTVLLQNYFQQNNYIFFATDALTIKDITVEWFDYTRKKIYEDSVYI